LNEKILVISEDGLPDIRVEKEIYTLIKHGYQVYFIGHYKGLTGVFDDLFKDKLRVYSIKWGKLTNLLIPIHRYFVKKKISKLINEIKPDVILAINPIAFYFVKDSSIPVVFDYHEIWSIMLKELEINGFHRKIYHWRRKKVYEWLEESLIPDSNIIVVSERRAKFIIEKYNPRRVFTLRNYPSRLEFENFNFEYLDCSTRVFTYVGRELLKYGGLKIRDLRLTLDVLKTLWSKHRNFKVVVLGASGSTYEFIDAKGFVKHKEIYSYTSRSHYGILSFKPSTFNPMHETNKCYIYAVSGAIPIITSDMLDTIDKINGYSIIVDAQDYNSDLTRKYEELLSMECDEVNKLRYNVFNYARSNLYWEIQEKTLIDAVKTA